MWSRCKVLERCKTTRRRHNERICEMNKLFLWTIFFPTVIHSANKKASITALQKLFFGPLLRLISFFVSTVTLRPFSNTGTISRQPSKHPSEFLADMFLIIFTPFEFLADICASNPTVYLADCHIFHLLWVPKSIRLPQLMIVLPPIARIFHQKVTSQNIPKLPKVFQSIPKPRFCFCSLFFPLSDTSLVSDWFPQPVLPVVSWLPLDRPIILCRRFLVIDRNLISFKLGRSQNWSE